MFRSLFFYVYVFIIVRICVSDLFKIIVYVRKSSDTKKRELTFPLRLYKMILLQSCIVKIISSECKTSDGVFISRIII